MGLVVLTEKMPALKKWGLEKKSAQQVKLQKNPQKSGKMADRILDIEADHKTEVDDGTGGAAPTESAGVLLSIGSGNELEGRKVSKNSWVEGRKVPKNSWVEGRKVPKHSWVEGRKTVLRKKPCGEGGKTRVLRKSYTIKKQGVKRNLWQILMDNERFISENRRSGGI